MAHEAQIAKIDAARKALRTAIGDRGAREAFASDPAVRTADAALNEIVFTSSPEELAAWAAWKEAGR